MSRPITPGAAQLDPMRVALGGLHSFDPSMFSTCFMAICTVLRAVFTQSFLEKYEAAGLAAGARTDAARGARAEGAGGPSEVGLGPAREARHCNHEKAGVSSFRSFWGSYSYLVTVDQDDCSTR